MNNEHLIVPFFLAFLFLMAAWKIVVDYKRLSAPAIGFGLVAMMPLAFLTVLAVDRVVAAVKG